MRKRFLALIFATAMLTSLTACGTGQKAADASTSAIAESETAEATKEQEKDSTGERFPAVGESYAGFQTEKVGEARELGAVTVELNHEKSGAKLVCIANDDQELGFAIAYRTPYIDETDTNHVFEHAIIAASEKYPSKDVFFDIANRTYSTFVNALTYNTFTEYPVCSQSQEQLEKMADVYLSCMVAPEVMENENYFKREALHYELEDKDSPIEMVGTVFSEDYGSLTDITSEANNNMMDAMYPGMTASHAIGRAHRNYKELTYEHTRETFDRCYHFDNSIILLYGDMDFKKMMDFINDEYLSKSEPANVDLSQYIDQEVKPGFTERVVEAPVYEGDTTEQASVIQYGIDMSKESWESILTAMVVTTMLNEDDAQLMKELRDAGISNAASADILLYTEKPYLLFTLSNADQEQSSLFKDTVVKALRDVADNGIPQDIYDTSLKKLEIYDYLVRNQVNLAPNVFAGIINFWTHTGDADYYGAYQNMMDQMRADKDQKMVHELATKLLEPETSALVTTVPKAGLAEQLDEERKEYLADMKAGLTEEELGQLIADTKAYKEWNESEQGNTDFVIKASELPDYELFSDFDKKEFAGITSYTSAVDLAHVGGYDLYLDSSTIPLEDRYYLGLFNMLAGMLDTKEHTAEEIKNLSNAYLYDLSMTPYYPVEEAGENSHPMFHVSWYGLTEDYENSLDLVLELFQDTNFGNREEIIYNLERTLPYYDEARCADKLSLAVDLTEGSIRNNEAYIRVMGGPEFYKFAEETLENLRADEGYIDTVKEKLEQISEHLLGSGHLISMVTANEDSLEQTELILKEKLANLPVINAAREDYKSLFDTKAKKAVIVESSDQCSYATNTVRNIEGFAGQTLSFLAAANDKYVVPKIRFQGGAYSAGAGYNAYSQMLNQYSYSDPRGKETLEIFRGLGDYVEDAELTEEELNSYVLNAYAGATSPTGVFIKARTSMSADMSNYDKIQAQKLVNEIRLTTLDDQKRAAEQLKEVFGTGAMATVGSERILNTDAAAYDEVLDYRQK